MEPLPKPRLLRFVERAVVLAHRAVGRFSTRYSRKRFTLRRHVVLLCPKVKKRSAYRDLGDELIEIPRIRDALSQDSIPVPSTLCETFFVTPSIDSSHRTKTRGVPICDLSLAGARSLRFASSDGTVGVSVPCVRVSPEPPFVTPANEATDARAVCVEDRFCDIVLPVGKGQFERGFRVDRFAFRNSSRVGRIAERRPLKSPSRRSRHPKEDSFSCEAKDRRVRSDPLPSSSLPRRLPAH